MTPAELQPITPALPLPSQDSPSSAEPTRSAVAGSRLEQVVLLALVCVALATVCGLAAAYVGRFSLVVVLALTAICGAPLLLWLRRRGLLAQPDRSVSATDLLAVVLALGVLGFGIVQRFHEVAGLRDPGVYIASGVELSRTGDFGWTDPLVAAHTFYGVSPLLQDLVISMDLRPRWLRFAGFYMQEDGRVTPQFLHGYEVWVALATSVGGVQAAMVLNAAFAALALLAIYCALRVVTGSGAAALIAVLLLAVNPAYLWHARSPGNEIMVQALLWGFVFLYGHSLRDRIPTREDAVSPAPQSSAREAALALLAFALLGTAALVKIAMWLLLPVAAFEAGYQRNSGTLRAPARVLWTTLVLSALVAVVHAGMFAGTYLYGSWKVSLSRSGLHYPLVPVLLVAGTAAGYSLGALTQPIGAALGRRVFQGRGPHLIAAAVALAFLLAWAWQTRQLHRLAVKKDMWSEATNLAEFALYLGPIPLMVCTLGLALLVAKRPHPLGNLFFLLLAGSSVFLIKRNLDATHPWASRRWLPFLYPAFCAGGGYLLSLIGSGKPAVPRRLAAAGGALLCAGLIISSAPQLLRTRQDLGIIPALDRFAGRLSAKDILLAHPTGDLLRWAPYLKARFDIEMYRHPYNPRGAADLYPLLRAAADEGRRLLYLNDGPLSMTLSQQRVLVPLAEEMLEFQHLPDAIRRPAREAHRTTQALALYQIRPEELSRRWWPGALEEPAPLPPHRPLPTELKLDRAAAPYLEHFFDADEPTSGVAYRWTSNIGRISLGDLIQLPPPGRTEPLRITIRMTSGRPERPEPLPVQVYLDHGLRKRQRLLETFRVGPGWTDFSLAVDVQHLRPDSFLELNCPRPPVGRSLRAAMVGCLVQSVRIE